MKNTRQRSAVIVIACFIFILSGCASIDGTKENKITTDETPQKKVLQYEAGAVVVRARRLTKLEAKKKEATRVNNRQTVEVAAGTAGAIAAYVAADMYFRNYNQKPNQLAALGATAAAAYLVSAAAGFIYDFFNEKGK
jgi:hypothetical protein